MISYLNIKNIAIISELELQLDKGLNILSGETGAGKSIVIDSINFVLGDRADRSLIRYGETTASVEVVFEDIKNFSEISSILSDAGIECEEDQIIITRKMTADKTECRINRKIVPLALLRSIISLLVDTHTQNEHQSLLKISNHIKILDGYTPAALKIKTPYRQNLAKYKELSEKIASFSNKEQREREIDMLGYQIAEIEKADVKEGEEEELKQKRSRFYNSQKITSALKTAHDKLNGNNNYGALPSIEESISELKRIVSYDDTYSELIDRLEACNIELSDVKETLYDKLYESESDNIDIDELEKRLEEIRLIAKKYGKTVDEVKKYYEDAQQKLDRLINAENELNKLNKEKEDLERTLLAQTDELHNVRVKAAEKFCKAISANISELGMKNAKFEVKIEKISDDCNDFNENGNDEVEFMLSPNVGEPVRSLAKIASGGEMSRFMLALKNVIAEIDNVDTLIFDEIDTGISGVIARVVAEKMYDIATNRQVIAITHLPQLGSMADVNYLIEKRVVGEKTMTFVNRLDQEEVIKELMRLSGAVENSEVGKNNAIELKQRADEYKRKKQMN